MTGRHISSEYPNRGEARRGKADYKYGQYEEKGRRQGKDDASHFRARVDRALPAGTWPPDPPLRVLFTYEEGRVAAPLINEPSFDCL